MTIIIFSLNGERFPDLSHLRASLPTWQLTRQIHCKIKNDNAKEKKTNKHKHKQANKQNKAIFKQVIATVLYVPVHTNGMT